MNPTKVAFAAVLVSLAPLAQAQFQSSQPSPWLASPGASIGTESVRAPASNADFPTFSAAAVGSQKLEAEGCVVRPVMTDAQLKICGATPPVYPPKKLVTDMIK
jgi:hypothetical protein